MRALYLLIILILFQACAINGNKRTQKDYEIADSIILYNKYDSIVVNELSIAPNYNSTDLQTFMYKNYGKWKYVIEVKRKTPMLVWKNIKLLETSEELFTVIVSGEDKKFQTYKINNIQKFGRIFYCSAIVFDSKNVDCFNPLSEIKDELAEYFIKGVKSIKENDKLVINGLN